MSQITAGFIGFGEVGPVFSRALADRGAKVLAYDVLQEEPGGEEAIRDRITADGIDLASLPELTEACEYIFSAVTTQVAEEVAQNLLPYLSEKHTYIDLNSTSPDRKGEIGAIVEEAGASFVEGAILGAVGASGADTRILLAGRTAENVARRLADLGLNTQFLSREIGKASQFKMLRSVFSKGVEALLIEMLVAAHRAGIEEELWKDITSYMDGEAFDVIAQNWVRSHAVAHERRYFEMHQVIETLDQLHVQPTMAVATLEIFERSTGLRLCDLFGRKPDFYLDVTQRISQLT